MDNPKILQRAREVVAEQTSYAPNARAILRGEWDSGYLVCREYAWMIEKEAEAQADEVSA